MTRHIFQTCPTGGDPRVIRDAFLSEPGAWLPEPAEHVEGDLWRIRLDAGPVSRTVEATVGPPWDLGEMTWRLLEWRVEEDSALHRLLPTFAGEIGFRAEDPGTIAIEGQYEPPGGAVGAALDAVAFHRVAERTVRSLVVGVTRRLQGMGAPA